MKRAGPNTSIDYASLAQCMRAVVTPLAGFARDNCEALDAAGLDLRPLIDHLEDLVERLRCGDIQTAAQKHSDFSVTPHPVWMARRKRKSADPARQREIAKLGGLAKSDKKLKAARTNGRKGGRPRAFAPEMLTDQLVQLARSMKPHPDHPTTDAKELLAQIRFLPVRVRYLVSRKLRQAKIPFESIGLSRAWNPSRAPKISIAPTIEAMIANARRNKGESSSSA